MEPSWLNEMGVSPLFIVLVAEWYIKGEKGLNEFSPSAVSCVVAPGMEVCESMSPRGPAC